MSKLKVHCVLIVTIVLWASAFVGIRIGLVAYSPGPMALLRFLVASLFMTFIYYYQADEKLMPWQDRLQLLFAGAIGVGLYSLCLNIGEITVSAGIASFVIGLMPVITICLSFVFLQERLNAGAWLGIFISLMGLLILALGEGGQADMRQGIALILVSALSGSFLTIRQKHFLQRYQTVTISAWVMWGGTIVLLFFTPALWQEVRVADYQSTVAVIYMGIFPAAIAYLAWSYVLKNLPASRATLGLYSLPIISTLLGFICLDEKPSTISLVGGSIALLGAFIAYRANLEKTVAVK